MSSKSLLSLSHQVREGKFEPVNADIIEGQVLPHQDALLSHIHSLAYIHALATVKGNKSKSVFSTELSETVTKLSRAFQLSSKQATLLIYHYYSEKERMILAIKQRFSELEKRVRQLAKNKFKNELLANQSDCIAEELEQVGLELNLNRSEVSFNFENRLNKITQNAFLLALKEKILLLTKSKNFQPKKIHQRQTSLIKEVAERFPKLELTPILLERASRLIETIIER